MTDNSKKTNSAVKYKTTIIVNFQLEGFHNWPRVEEHFPEVDFLKHRHRHMFWFKAEKAVNHDDRHLEIILFKREMIAYLKDRYAAYEGDEVDPLLYTTHLEFGAMSCEMIAKELVKNFGLKSCEVLEDGENGARVEKESVEKNQVVFVAGLTACGKGTFVNNHLSDFTKFSVSDYVKQALEIQDKPTETTEQLNDSKDVDELAAKLLWDNMVPLIRQNDYSIVIEGPRQKSIIDSITSNLNTFGIQWQLIWLDVPYEERLRRFKKRNRKRDEDSTLQSLDEKNFALGIEDIRTMAEHLNKATIIEN